MLQSAEDVNDEEKKKRHTVAINKKRELINRIKDYPEKPNLLLELLAYSHETVRLQATYLLLFDLEKKKKLALNTLRKIKKDSTNELNKTHASLLIHRQEGYIYSLILTIVANITLITVIALGLYYTVFNYNHTGPMDLWAIILLINVGGIYMLLVIIARVKKITLYDGSEKTLKFAKPLI